MNILTVDNITKHYKSVTALKNVSFSVPEGSVYGILGPNGSGKTTLLGIVTDVLLADEGGYELFEDRTTPKAQLRKRIGTLLETPNFYHYLSAYDNLRITAEIKGIGEDGIDGVLQKTGLYGRRFSKFSTFSLGMKQRLGIAACLLGDPKVLILDEPTNGLDPEGISEIRELIKSLGASGRTIIMASHLLDEVEKVCTHVAVLKNGQLLADGRSDEILNEGDIIEVGADDTDKLYAALGEIYAGRQIVRGDGTVRVLLDSRGTADTAGLNRECFARGIVLTRIVLTRKSLESIFLELVNTGKRS